MALRPSRKGKPTSAFLLVGEPTLLIVLALPAAAIDWQIAQTWSIPTWISLLSLASMLAAVGVTVARPRWREMGSAAAVALLYGLPVVGGIVRWHLVPSTTALIGDGAYQMQLSRDVLMRGIDPYGFNYVGTGMEHAPWAQSFPNPSLHHLDYWPGTVLLPLPLQAAFKAVFGWWDERIWLLLAAAVIWMLLQRLAPGPAGRMAAVVVFLMPSHGLLAVLGDNDLPMVALLLVATLAISKRRWLLAGLFIGLAIATKQTALIGLPVLMAYALVGQGIDRRRFIQATGVAAGVVAILFAPFLLWNAGAFVADTLVFNFGGGTETYPIQGIGLSSWMLQTGIIHGARDPFPFLAIQLPLVIAAWAYALHWLRRHRFPGDAILCVGMAFFVFLFANRFAQPAYLLLGVELIIAGLIARLPLRLRSSSDQRLSAAA